MLTDQVANQRDQVEALTAGMQAARAAVGFAQGERDALAAENVLLRGALAWAKEQFDTDGYEHLPDWQVWMDSSVTPLLASRPSMAVAQMLSVVRAAKSQLEQLVESAASPVAAPAQPLADMETMS